MSHLFNTTEFYVIAVVVAAALVALLARRPASGPARRFTLDGRLLADTTDALSESQLLISEEDGVVLIRRSGLNGGLLRRAAIDVEVKGFDIRISEWLDYGPDGTEVEAVEFQLDFLAREVYHISYHAAATPEHPEMTADFSLNVRPNLHTSRSLH